MFSERCIVLLARCSRPCVHNKPCHGRFAIIIIISITIIIISISIIR